MDLWSKLCFDWKRLWNVTVQHVRWSQRSEDSEKYRDCEKCKPLTLPSWRGAPRPLAVTHGLISTFSGGHEFHQPVTSNACQFRRLCRRNKFQDFVPFISVLTSSFALHSVSIHPLCPSNVASVPQCDYFSCYLCAPGFHHVVVAIWPKTVVKMDSRKFRARPELSQLVSQFIVSSYSPSSAILAM